MIGSFRHFVLVFVAIVATASAAFSQATPTPHQADLLFRDGKIVRRVSVTISQDKDNLVIKGTDKKKPFSLTIPIKEIKGADYTYTEKPMAWEAIGTTSYIVMLSGYVGVADLAIFLPTILTKKKQHWLVLDTNGESMLFQLRNKDYRQLILEMSQNGINTTDSGKARKPDLKARP